MKYRLHPEAEKDLDAAAGYYFERSGSGLSQAFLNEFEHTVSQILQHPRIGAISHRNTRRAVMRKFPYSIVYSLIAPEKILLIAVAHQSRRPDYWKNR